MTMATIKTLELIHSDFRSGEALVKVKIGTEEGQEERYEVGDGTSLPDAFMCAFKHVFSDFTAAQELTFVDYEVRTKRSMKRVSAGQNVKSFCYQAKMDRLANLGFCVSMRFIADECWRQEESLEDIIEATARVCFGAFCRVLLGPPTVF